jgi:hypothetical protein
MSKDCKRERKLIAFFLEKEYHMLRRLHRNSAIRESNSEEMKAWKKRKRREAAKCVCIMSMMKIMNVTAVR